MLQLPASPNAFRFELDPLAMEGLDLDARPGPLSTGGGSLNYLEHPFSLSSSVDSPDVYSPVSYSQGSLLEGISSDHYGFAALADEYEFTKRPTATNWTVPPSRLSASLALSDLQPSHVQPSQLFAGDFKVHHSDDDSAAVDFGSVFNRQLDYYDMTSPVSVSAPAAPEKLKKPQPTPPPSRPTPQTKPPAAPVSPPTPTPTITTAAVPATPAPPATASPICTNCSTQNTPLWRRDPQGQPLCNACGLFLKLHGVVRPLSLKTNVIKKRNRGSGSSGGSISSSSNNNSISSSGGAAASSASRNSRRRWSNVDNVARDAVRKSKSRRNSISSSNNGVSKARVSATPTPIALSPSGSGSDGL